MAETYVAKANVVKVSIGPADGNRVVRFIRVGGVIPEGVDEETLKSLAKRGLIERVKTAPTQTAAAKTKADADAAAKAKAEADAAAKAKADADAKAAAEKAATEKATTK